uniref:Cation/H(+) antiporter 20 n=1 Tax=Anthurium amnicola TaxID=1678845 RepID=A0A1D1Y2A9_9ARAE
MALLTRPPAATTLLPCYHPNARGCSSRLLLPVLPRSPAGGGRRGSHGSSSSREIVMALTAEEGPLERPRWAGETPLSRLVGALISFKPLYALMKMAARKLIISTAEKSNVPWRAMVKEILESDVYQEMEKIRDISIVYPDYYLKPFHAYDEGNLSWLAAAEAEAATMAIAKRAIPDASIDEANKIVRGKWLHAIEQHIQRYSENSVINDILDIGCSMGFSTRCLAEKFPSAKVTHLGSNQREHASFGQIGHYRCKPYGMVFIDLCSNSRERLVQSIHDKNWD